MLGIGKRCCRGLLHTRLAGHVGLLGHHHVDRPLPACGGPRPRGRGIIGIRRDGQIAQKLFDEIDAELAPHAPAAHDGRGGSGSEQVGGGDEQVVAGPLRQFCEAIGHLRLQPRHDHDLRPLRRRREPIGKRKHWLARHAEGERPLGDRAIAHELVGEHEPIAERCGQRRRPCRRDRHHAIKRLCEPGRHLGTDLGPIATKRPHGLDAERALDGRRLEAAHRQAASRGIADAAGVAQQRARAGAARRWIIGGDFAGRAHGQEFERQIPEQAIGHDHELFDTGPERDLRVFEEQPLHPLGRGRPVGFEQPLGGDRRHRIDHADRLREPGDLLGERRGPLHLPGGHACVRLEKPGEAG